MDYATVTDLYQGGKRHRAEIHKLRGLQHTRFSKLQATIRLCLDCDDEMLADVGERLLSYVRSSNERRSESHVQGESRLRNDALPELKGKTSIIANKEVVDVVGASSKPRDLSMHGWNERGYHMETRVDRDFEGEGALASVKLEKDGESWRFPVFRDHQRLLRDVEKKVDRFMSVYIPEPGMLLSRKSGGEWVGSAHLPVSISDLKREFRRLKSAVAEVGINMPKYRLHRIGGRLYMKLEGITVSSGNTASAEVADVPVNTLGKLRAAMIRKITLELKERETINRSFVVAPSRYTVYADGGMFDAGMPLSSIAHLMAVSYTEGIADFSASVRARLLFSALCGLGGWIIGCRKSSKPATPFSCIRFARDAASKWRQSPTHPSEIIDAFCAVAGDAETVGSRFSIYEKYENILERMKAMYEKKIEIGEKLHGVESVTIQALMASIRCLTHAPFNGSYLAVRKEVAASPWLYQQGIILASSTIPAQSQSVDEYNECLAQTTVLKGEYGIEQESGSAEEVLTFLRSYYSWGDDRYSTDNPEHLTNPPVSYGVDVAFLATAGRSLLEDCGFDPNDGTLPGKHREVEKELRTRISRGAAVLLDDYQRNYESLALGLENRGEHASRLANLMSFMLRWPLSGFARVNGCYVPATEMSVSEYSKRNVLRNSPYFLEKFRKVMRVAYDYTRDPIDNLRKKYKGMDKNTSSAGFGKIKAALTSGESAPDQAFGSKQEMLAFLPPAIADDDYDDDEETTCLGSHMVPSSYAYTYKLYVELILEGTVASPGVSGFRDDKARFKARGIFPVPVFALVAEALGGVKEFVDERSKLESQFPRSKVTFTVSSSKHKTEVRVTNTMRRMLYDNVSATGLATDFSGFDTTMGPVMLVVGENLLRVSEQLQKVVDGVERSGVSHLSSCLAHVTGMVFAGAGTIGHGVRLRVAGVNMVYFASKLLSGMRDTSSDGSIGNASVTTSSVEMASGMSKGEMTKLYEKAGLDPTEVFLQGTAPRLSLVESHFMGDDFAGMLKIGCKRDDYAGHLRAGEALADAYRLHGMFMKPDSFIASNFTLEFLNHVSVGTRRGRGGFGVEKETDRDEDREKNEAVSKIRNFLINLTSQKIGSKIASVQLGLSSVIRWGPDSYENGIDAVLHPASGLPDPFVGMVHMVKASSTSREVPEAIVYEDPRLSEDYNPSMPRITSLKIGGVELKHDYGSIEKRLSRINKFVDPKGYGLSQRASASSHSAVGELSQIKRNAVKFSEIVGKKVDKSDIRMRELRKEPNKRHLASQSYVARLGKLGGRTVAFEGRSLNRGIQLRVTNGEGYMGCVVELINKGMVVAREPVGYPKAFCEEFRFVTSILKLTEDSSPSLAMSFGKGFYKYSGDELRSLSRMGPSEFAALGLTQRTSQDLKVAAELDKLDRTLTSLQLDTGTTFGETALSHDLFRTPVTEAAEKLRFNLASSDEQRVKSAVEFSFGQVLMASACYSLTMHALSCDCSAEQMLVEARRDNFTIDVGRIIVA